jgi:hypothetical protein
MLDLIGVRQLIDANPKLFSIVQIEPIEDRAAEEVEVVAVAFPIQLIRPFCLFI